MWHDEYVDNHQEKYREKHKETHIQTKFKWQRIFNLNCSLMTPYSDIDMGQQIGSSNGLLPDGAKSLPETMLTRDYQHPF